MWEMALLAIAAITGIILALQALGLDVRIWGRQMKASQTVATQIGRWVKIRSWIALTLSSTALVVASINFYQARMLDDPNARYMAGDFEVVAGKAFGDYEKVELDGKSFERCVFGANVDLIFRGKKKFQLIDNRFPSTGVNFKTTDRAAFEFSKMLATLKRDLPMRIDIIMINKEGSIIYDEPTK